MTVEDAVNADVIQVVLADDHAVVRAGLRAVLGKARDIAVVGEGKSGREAVELAERYRPAVVVMDLDMDDGDGVWATQEIVSRGLPTRVLVLTMHEEQSHLTAVLSAGASGYLVKSAAERELVEAIRRIAYGDMYLRPTAALVIAQQLTRKDPTHADRERFATLSTREREVFQLIARGYSGPEIGAMLKISAKTVETYKQRIHEKVAVSHRAEYIRLAVRLHVLDE